MTEGTAVYVAATVVKGIYPGLIAARDCGYGFPMTRHHEPDDVIPASAIERLRDACRVLILCMENAPPGTWENGNTDPSGCIDEGLVLTGQALQEARDALALFVQAPERDVNAIGGGA